MDLSLFLAADYATVDASGKLNVLGAFNTIFASQFPTRHASMHLVVRLQPQLGEFGDTRQLRIELVDEDSTRLLEMSGEVQIPDAHGEQQPEFTTVIGLQGVAFPHPGVYEFRLFVDKDSERLSPALSKTEAARAQDRRAVICLRKRRNCLSE